MLRLLMLGAIVFSSPANAGYDCTAQIYKSAKSKMQLAFATGILANNPTDKYPLNVLISDRFWSTMTLPSKVAFADELVCAIAGEGKGLRSLQFRSLTTGKPVGDWDMGTLTIP